MKRFLKALTIIFFMTLVSCTQAERMPSDEVATAVLTSLPTLTPTTEIAPTITAIAEIQSAPSPTRLMPTASPTPTIMPTEQAGAPNQADGRSNSPAISADGQIMAFTSTANLTGNAPGGNDAVFVRDRTVQTTELINVTLDGQAGERPIYGLALSGNGRVVAYYSHDGNLVPDDELDCGSESEPLSCEDLFIYDRDTASTERIPLGRSQGLGADYTLALSADGRFVAYSYHIYDRTTGQTTDMPTTDGERPNGPVFAPRFAGNGNFLAFVSRAGNLVAGDTNEVHDVFVWNRETNEVERVSVATGNSEGNDSSGAFQFHEGTGSDLAYSEDGRFVAFSSLATNLTSDLVNECDDYRGYSRACYNLFLHERESDETRLITRGANQDSSSPALSADGRFLTFASLATSFTDDILPECPFPAMVNCGQIYLYEGQIDKFSLISRGINGQTGNQGSWQPVVSGDGRFITFVSSADNLVSGDTNNASDIFVFDQQTKQIERVSLTHTAD